MCIYQTVMFGAGLEKAFMICYVHFTMFEIKTIKNSKTNNHEQQ